MGAYLIVDRVTNQSRIVSLEEATAIAQLYEAEIEWAIEEEGVCETDRHIVKPACQKT